jgi:hypothetical protein
MGLEFLTDTTGTLLLSESYKINAPPHGASNYQEDKSAAGLENRSRESTRRTSSSRLVDRTSSNPEEDGRDKSLKRVSSITEEPRRRDKSLSRVSSITISRVSSITEEPRLARVSSITTTPLGPSRSTHAPDLQSMPLGARHRNSDRHSTTTKPEAHPYRAGLGDKRASASCISLGRSASSDKSEVCIFTSGSDRGRMVLMPQLYTLF